MNAPIVNDAFQFVKCLYRKYLPAGFRSLQLDQGMELKNLCTSRGLRKGLTDEEMEILALAALLHNTGSIEGVFDDPAVSQTIAERFLRERNYPDTVISQVLSCIAATHLDSTPQTSLGRFIQSVKFSKIGSYPKKQGEVGDLWP